MSEPRKIVLTFPTSAAEWRVILRALPSYLAVASLVLTVVATEVVPMLPDHVAVRLGGWVAVALAWVATISNVVARLTPAEPESYGLLPPPPPPA